MQQQGTYTAEIAIVGAGNWGTTLAVVLARSGRDVLLCTRTAAAAELLQEERENSRSLAGIRFPDNLVIAPGFGSCGAARLVVLAVASEHLRSTCAVLASTLSDDQFLVSATKGLEQGSALRGSQVIAQVLPDLADRLAILSGPNLAGEIVAGLPAASVVASSNHEVAVAAAGLLGTRLFRLYTSGDVIGVELGGSLKNVVALAAGICDGLGMGLNAKAAIVTRGMAEIVRLGVACGADPATFAGLSGFGDLFATCSSVSSRNHFLGVQLGEGVALPEALAAMTMVAEGVGTAPAAQMLATKLGVEMPITEQVCSVLFNGKSARQAVSELLSRLNRDERTGELL